MTRKAPYTHADGTDCYTKNCQRRLRQQAQQKQAKKEFFNPVLSPVEVNPQAVDFSNSKTYRKIAIVTMRVATPGEKLSTVLADGTVETTRVLEGGEHIVQNPGKEEYAISPEKFNDLYEPLP